MPPEIICITGPTAAGKSKLALDLACKIKAEIISCDSMLFYREINIINSKPSLAERREIKHYMIDLISVSEEYDVFRYQKEVKRILKENPQKKFIICGGSGLYLKALLDGIFEGGGKNEALRQKLKKEAEEKGVFYLYDKLYALDKATAEKVSKNDLRRIIRALEVYYSLGVPLSSKKKEARGLWGRIPIKIYGIFWERDKLYQRIEERVEEMFAQGAIEEAKALENLTLSKTVQGLIGIKEIRKYLAGKLSLSEAKEEMKKNTRHLAKKQMTWFRKEKRIEWLRAEEAQEKILKSIC